MNKTRLIGLLFIILGSIFHYVSDNSAYDLFIGIIFGVGIGLLILGLLNQSRA